MPILTLEGGYITPNVTGDGIYIYPEAGGGAAAKITTPNLVAGPGIVHIIDGGEHREGGRGKGKKEKGV